MSIITRDLPPLALRAAFSPSSVNAEQRTIGVTWSTGAKALRRFDAALDIWKPFYEELSLKPEHVRLARLNAGAPLLDGHPERTGDMRAVTVRGTVVPGTARVDGKVGTATVRFARAEDDPEADILFRKVADGIVQQVSIGYRIHKAQEVTAAADTIPTYRMIDWEPFEISTVSIGEDAGAGFRGADARTNPCEFIPRFPVPGRTDADRCRLLALAQAQSREFELMQDDDR